MTDLNARPALEQELKKLDRRLDELMATVVKLKEENRALRTAQDNLATERSVLIQKNDQVRHRVEAMIGRLRSMEQGT
jgi:cell division protein ZapB